MKKLSEPTVCFCNETTGGLCYDMLSLKENPVKHSTNINNKKFLTILH